MSTKKRRSAIVPRAVFAAVVTLSSVPACASHESRPSRAAELRPVAPPSSAPTPSPRRSTDTPPTPTAAAELRPLGPPSATVIDAGPDLGSAHARRRTHRILVHPPPPPYGVAMTVAVRDDYRQYGVAATVAARDLRVYGVAAD